MPWYENDGGHPPTFLRHLMSDWASLSRPIAADLNGDGRQDVIVGTQWFRNLGGNPPIFSDCYEAVAGDHFPRVAADLDQDGDTDVAGSYRHAPHEFAWLENSGHFVVHAGSALVHGEGGPNEAELTLNLDETGGIEPRLGGPQKLLIELDAHYNPSSFAREQVRVICSDYEPIVASVSPHTDSRTVVVELASPISSDECCTVHLGGIVSLDRVAVTSPYRLGVLEGDTTGDGGVSGGDAASIRPWFGVVGPDGQPNPRYDVDRSGAITPADRDWVILRFGRTLPACP